MAKSAILAVRIIGDATGATKALKETETSLDKFAGGAALAGGAAAAALTAGFVDAVSVEAGLDKVQAQLGLTESEAARVGTVSAELFANAWGTGADQVNEALSSVVGNIGGMRDATEADLTKVSQEVLSVANAFDQDLGGVTTAVGQMMRTGMAKDATEALDIITSGLQSNTRAGDDLLDTFTEYPALFERLGIDGKTATGLIAQGLDAGARSTDLVADALKEFQIRATDGSEASSDAFAALGIDAAAMTKQIAEGGEGASSGLDKVLDSLRGMEDPVARNAAAVGLFGTQAEDLGGALYALDPSAATDALGEVGGAATALGDTMRDNAQTTITEFTREVQTSFSEIAAQAIPVIEPVIAKLKEFAPILGPLAVVIGILSGAFLVINGAMKAYAAIQAIQTAAQWANNTAWLASPITWIILAVIAGIALLVTAIVLVVKHWDTIKEKAVEVWQTVIGWIQSVIDWIQVRIVTAIAIVVARFLVIRATAIAVFQAVIQWVRDAVSWLGSKLTAPITRALQFFYNLRDGAVGVFQSIINWVKNAIDWIGNLAANAVPGWAKSLLGMESRSMMIEPEVATFSMPSFYSTMALTPTVEDASFSTFATPTTSLMSTLAMPKFQPTQAPRMTVEDNRSYTIAMPNYMGDKNEIIEELRDALRKAEQNDRGIVYA